MKLGTLLTINAVLATGFAIPLLGIPDSFLPIYGIETTPGALLLARAYGGALAGFGILCWQSRALAEGSPGARAVVVSLAAANIIGLVVALVGRLQGVDNAMGWLTVAIYLLFAAGYAAAAMRKPATASAPY